MPYKNKASSGQYPCSFKGLSRGPRWLAKLPLRGGRTWSGRSRNGLLISGFVLGVPRALGFNDVREILILEAPCQ